LTGGGSTANIGPMQSPDRPNEPMLGVVPTDPMLALIELRDRMQELHAQLEYAKLLLRLQAWPQP
jgi:hypothetical protein